MTHKTELKKLQATNNARSFLPESNPFVLTSSRTMRRILAKANKVKHGSITIKVNKSDIK